MRLSPGAMDRRITIERKYITTGDFNEEVIVWAPVATVWAKKLDVSDGERLRAREVAADITTRFQVRWSQAVRYVDAEHRLKYDGLIYDIFGVKEIGRREGLEISATARAENAGNG